MSTICGTLRQLSGNSGEVADVSPHQAIDADILLANLNSVRSIDRAFVTRLRALILHAKGKSVNALINMLTVLNSIHEAD